MKTKGSISRKGLYAGAAAGLLLYILVGLLPSSFIGGLIGLKIAGGIFGSPVTYEIFPRIIVGITMLAAVLVSGSVFVAGVSVIGWLTGHVADILRAGRSIDIPMAEAGRKV